MTGEDVENKGGKHRREKLYHEVVTYWINAVYMAVIFSVFTNYRRLILAHYEISYEEYGIGIIKALVLAKVVMIADALRLGRGLDDKPLSIPTLYKTFVFTLFVLLFSVIESMIRGLVTGKGLSGELMGLFTYEGCAGLLVVFFTFIPFFAFRELSRVLGQGEIQALFFRGRDGAGSAPSGPPPPGKGERNGEAPGTQEKWRKGYE